MGPITFILVATLGAMLAMVFKQLFRKDPPPPPKPAEDLANLKITDARMGDMLSVTGAGDEFSDLEFTIDRWNQYEAGQKQWFELGGMYRERRVYLDVVDADELEVTAVLHPNKLTLEDLGLNEQDLSEMDDRQNTADNFPFDGKVWCSVTARRRAPATTCGSSARMVGAHPRPVCSTSARVRESRLRPALPLKSIQETSRFTAAARKGGSK
jgi:hypothetical protein